MEFLDFIDNDLTIFKEGAVHNSPNVENDSSPVMGEEVKWNNEDNNAFYETLKADGLQKLAEKGGLASGCDVRALTPYWSNAQSILEVGAGYGRVIDYLLKHQFQGEITAIERCDALFKHLEKQFNPYENVKLLQTDIHYLSDMNNRFDLILCMWSGIADFPREEQPLIVEELARLLQRKGKLIIDTMPASIIPLGSKRCGHQSYSIEINGSTVCIHLPNIQEMKCYAKKAGFSDISYISYKTDADRERWLFILS